MRVPLVPNPKIARLSGIPNAMPEAEELCRPALQADVLRD